MDKEPSESIERPPEAPSEPGAPPLLEEPAPVRRQPRAGDEVQVFLTNGDRLEGMFESGDDARLSLRIGGVTVGIDRVTIDRIVVLEPPAERYRKMRARIKDDDAERLIVLADWLRQRRLYDEALVELANALAADPSNAEALRLKRVVEQLAALAERRGDGTDAQADRDRQIERARRFPDRPKATEFPLLTPEQINLIKVYEVDLRDPPDLAIPRETIERLLVKYGEEPIMPGTREEREAFFRKPAHEVLDAMFRLRAREFYGEVQVSGQPRSMRRFRDDVHAGWLVTTCASTACHGGSESGRLRLFNYRPTADASVYTNFLILERFRTRQGEALIDYENPERSLLVQYALPRGDVRFPHPEIPGWRPAFRDREARRYAATIEWIRSMYRPRPDYPVEYDPPVPADLPGRPGPHEPVER